jgi:hypothetical protein
MQDTGKRRHEMGGNRKHGFRRGNANGRNGNHAKDWFCDGCQKMHGYKITAWGTLDGRKLCSRQSEKEYKQQKENQNGKTTQTQ